MPTYLLLLIAFLSVFNVQAQNDNLIYNGSFEEKARCTEYVAMIGRHKNFVWGWYSPTCGSPDYFNACSEKGGVPNNWIGYAEPYHGGAYMGIIACMQQQEQKQFTYREYLSSRLRRKLDSGQVYFARMQVMHGLSCNTASNGIGMYFSEIPLHSVRSSNFPVKAQILKQNDPVITEHDTWVEICGTFTATGNERYLTIGNFWSNQQMKYLSIDEEIISTNTINNIAYYYLDKVEVYKQDSPEHYQCEADELITAKPFESYLPEQGRLVLSQVNFEHDKATLLAGSYTELNRLAAALHRNQNMRVSINGHTDNTGTSAYNQELSLQRAKSVRNYLLERGVSNFLLEIRGVGNTEPLAGNENEEGRSLNRRVEIEIIP